MGGGCKTILYKMGWSQEASYFCSIWKVEYMTAEDVLKIPQYSRSSRSVNPEEPFHMDTYPIKKEK